MPEQNSQELYIVISQTGTLLSRILRLITGAEYNHASIGLTPDLELMYSFGRKKPYNPLYGGFVIESPHFGTFKRFSNTKVIVLSLKVESEKYKAIEELIHTMVACKKEYGYNYLGLGFAAFKKPYKCHNRYYCSEFVKYILQKHEIKGADKLKEIVEPIHFLSLPEVTNIYCGKLKDYKYIDNKILA